MDDDGDDDRDGDGDGSVCQFSRRELQRADSDRKRNERKKDYSNVSR